MPVFGNIDLWKKRFPQDQIPRILQLILDSWDTFIVPSERLEVPITKRFCAHLRNNKDQAIHYFRIELESMELDQEGKEEGRIDLKFSQGWNEQVYFSVECKRLRVNPSSGFKSLAGEYVKEGMVRYFNGQYAQGLDKGGMLGYVMDGNLNEAIKNVTDTIEKYRSELCMAKSATLQKSSILRSVQAKETLHQFGPDGTFVIHHIFLPLTDSVINAQ